MIMPDLMGFRPDARESDRHALAKSTLVICCEALGMEVYTEHPIETPYKTYYCDVLATFKMLGLEVKLDLEVEDYDSTKHDFADSINKARELSKMCIKTIWLRSDQILRGPKANPEPRSMEFICYVILAQMANGKTVDPRMNL